MLPPRLDALRPSVEGATSRAGARSPTQHQVRMTSLKGIAIIAAIAIAAALIWNWTVAKASPQLKIGA